MSRSPCLKVLCEIYILGRPSWWSLLIISGSNLGIILFSTNWPVNFYICTSCRLLLNLDLLFTAGYRLEQRHRALARLSEEIRRQRLRCGGARGINLVELLQLARTCLSDIVQHSLQIFVMRQIGIRNDAIKTWTSYLLWLCQDSIILFCLRIFGDFNESTRSHLGACPSNEELIILQVD